MQYAKEKLIAVQEQVSCMRYCNWQIEKVVQSGISTLDRKLARSGTLNLIVWFPSTAFAVSMLQVYSLM
jgi:hypothetical protein